MRRPRSLLLIPACLLLLAPGCRGERPGAGAADAGEEEGAPVEVVRAARGTVSDAIPATGTISARTEVMLTVQIPGTVGAVRVEEGAEVRAGDTLARIDRPTASTELAKARAGADKARRDAKDAEAAATRGVVPERELKEAQFVARQAQLDLRRLEKEQALARIESPMDGVVVARELEPGQPVATGAPAFRVADLGALEVELRIPERHLPSLREGMPVEVESAGAGAGAVRGRVARVAPTVDPRTGTVKVTVDLGDGRTPDGARLRPGMFVRARVVVDTHENAVLVPKRAVLYENDRPVIFRVVEGRAERIFAELGYDDRSRVEVGPPVAMGDAIIVFGHSGLKDQALVRVVRGDDAADGAASSDAGTAREIQ
jgi:membrane fusion protein (multidrug efflux system)